MPRRQHHLPIHSLTYRRLKSICLPLTQSGTNGQLPPIFIVGLCRVIVSTTNQAPKPSSFSFFGDCMEGLGGRTARKLRMNVGNVEP